VAAVFYDLDGSIKTVYHCKVGWEWRLGCLFSNICCELSGKWGKGDAY